MDLDGGKPWDVKWIKIDQKIYSLNDIEHEILRKKYKDERIHFALNCASKSCPPLLNVAYTPDSVLAQMDKQTKAFINNPSFNSISSKTLHISKIFEWYKVDFKNVINFIGKYSTTKINPQSTINYRTYDWSLNGY